MVRDTIGVYPSTEGSRYPLGYSDEYTLVPTLILPRDMVESDQSDHSIAVFLTKALTVSNQMRFIYPAETLVRSNNDLLCTFTADTPGWVALHPGILHQKRNIVGVAFSKDSLDKNKIREVSFISNDAPITTISREVIQAKGEVEQSNEGMEIIVNYFPIFHKEWSGFMDFFVKVYVNETVDIYVRYGPEPPDPEGEGEVFLLKERVKVFPLKERVKVWEKIPIQAFVEDMIQVSNSPLRTFVDVYSTFSVVVQSLSEDKETISKDCMSSSALKELIGPLPYQIKCLPEDQIAVKPDPSLTNGHFIQFHWDVEVTYADGMLGLPFIPFSSNN